MEKNIITFFELLKIILGVDYYSDEHLNDFKKQNQEEIVLKILIDHGLQYIDDNKKIKSLELEPFKKIDSVDDNFFFYQPFGSHNPPDFIIVINKICYYVELKSSITSGNIIWNTSLPHDNFIYLFSSKKYNDNIIFLGGDIISNNVKDVYQNYINEIRNISDKLNEDLKNIEDNTFNFSYYPRNMFIQKKNNYFKDDSIKNKLIDSVFNKLHELER